MTWGTPGPDREGSTPRPRFDPQQLPPPTPSEHAPVWDRQQSDAQLPTPHPGPGDPDALPPRTAGQGGVWLGIAVFGFAVGQVMSAVFLYIGAASSGNVSALSRLVSRSVPPGWVVVCGLVGLWVGFLGAAFMASRAQGTGSLKRDMRLAVRPWDFLVGPLVGAAGQLVLLPLLYVPLEPLVPNLSQRLSQPAKHLTGGFPGADLVVIAVLTVLVVPIIEETFFRGLVLHGFLAVFRGAGRAVGPVLACVATGIVFGLAHFEALQLLGLAAFGVVLSVMAYKFRRIGPCILAHATFNLLAVLVVAFPTGLAH